MEGPNVKTSAICGSDVGFNVTNPLPSTLLLLVSGEPGPDTDPANYRSFGATLASLFIPPTLLVGQAKSHPESTTSSPDVGVSWHIPRASIPCVNLVLEIAKSKGWEVALVNANASGQEQGLVSRWVGPGDLLPVLVRPDGERLAGLDSFTPGNVRRFLTKP